MATKQHNDDNDAPSYLRLDPLWRRLISALLVFHLVAIFLPPFGFQTGGSPIIEWLMGAVRDYDNALYLNHGYAFFAPNPGPSTLVEFKLEFDDGRPAIEQTFPDLDRHWPRLLYHRHFMLSEHLEASFTPAELPRELMEPPPRDSNQSEKQWKEAKKQWEDQVERWEKSRSAYEARWRSFEKHLLAHYGAQHVTMLRVRHYIPPPMRTTNRVNLRDEASYQKVKRDEPFPNLPPGALP